MSLQDAKSAADVSSVEQALERLAEIDELLGSDGGDDQSILLSYLHKDEDLLATAALQEKKLYEQCDDFVGAHVANADSIVRMYREFGECEKKLDEFETGIVDFQRRLASSADDIVLMQQQTERLQRSVRHRKQVSRRITEVYSALQECDTFCARIAHDDVDDGYFSILREVAHKLSFLSNNTELLHSAVGNEIRPKLSAAAASAGKRLLLFYSDAIDQLVESSARDMAAVGEQQAYLEQVTQMGYRFLSRYNAPVAQKIRQRYVQSMQVAYGRLFRDRLRVFEQQSSRGAWVRYARQGYPLITASEAYAILGNVDEGAPAGAAVEVSSSVVFPHRTAHASNHPVTHKPHRSTSTTMNNSKYSNSSDSDSDSHSDSSDTMTDTMDHAVKTNRDNIGRLDESVCVPSEDNARVFTVDSTAPRCATASLMDAHHVTRALRMRYGKLVLDPLPGRGHGDESAAVRTGAMPGEAVEMPFVLHVGWLWLFTRLLLFLVNTCVAECHFIGTFFDTAEEAGGREHYEEAERMARAVLDADSTLSTMQHGLRRSMADARDRWALLAALRVVETAKHYLCTSLDPIPLLLLSGVLETIKSTLTSAMRVVMCHDLHALDFIAHTALTPFQTGRRRRGGSGSSRETDRVRLEWTADMSSSSHALLPCKGLTEALQSVTPIHTLGPHGLMVRVAILLSHLHRLNTVALRGGGGLGIASAAEDLVAANTAAASSSPYASAAASPSASSIIESRLSDTRGCDAAVTNLVRTGMLTHLPRAARRLAHRHEKGLPRATFALVNVYAVWAIWREMMTTEDVMSCAAPVNVTQDESGAMRANTMRRSVDNDSENDSSSSRERDSAADEENDEDRDVCDESTGCSTATTSNDLLALSLPAWTPRSVFRPP